MTLSATVIKGPAGSGKTQQMAAHIAQRETSVVEVYQPTHRLGDEWMASVLNYNPNKRVIVIKGREALDGQGQPLCIKHQLAQQLSQKGLSVYPNLCRSSQGKGKAPLECQRYHHCAYIQQFGPADVYIYTHAHLPLERGELETWKPGLVVIDESFFQSCLQKLEFSATLLLHPALPAKATAICSDIHQHLLQYGLAVGLQRLFNRSLLPALEEARVALIQANKTKLQPDMNALQQTPLIAHAVSFYPLIVLMQHLAWAALTTFQIQSMDFDAMAQTLTIHHRHNITRFDGLQAPPRILLLDASASQTVIDPFFNVGAIKPIHVKRIAMVTQCRSTRCSNTSLMPMSQKTPARQQAATDRLKDVQTFIDRLEGRGLKLLVVGPSAITGNPNCNIPALLTVSPGSELAHFNAVRGVDHWKGMGAIILIGRNQPPVKAVEDIARALFWGMPGRLGLTGKWTTAVKGYRTLGEPYGVEVEVHADPRVQAVHEQVREEESLQAIDRLRLIYPEQDKQVFVLSNLVLDLEVHQLLDWHDITHGTRLEQAKEALACGVLPLRPKWLSDRFMALWPTEKAAKEDVTRTYGEGFKKAHISNSISIGKLSPFGYYYQYKYRSQRQWSWCLADSPEPALVQQQLKLLLNEAVQLRPPQPATDLTWMGAQLPAVVDVVRREAPESEPVAL